MFRGSSGWITLTALILFAAALSAGGQNEQREFKGYISDSQCAMNVHSLSRSHKEMLKTGDFGKTPADCVWYCITQRGGRFVLQSGKKVYKLDDQNIDRELAAKKVRVTGTLDEKTDTIHVLRIEKIGR